MKKYDTLDVIIEETEKDFIFPDKLNQCKILINGEELLKIISYYEDIFAKNESDLTTFVPGEYIYMMPSELYKGLVDAEISNGKISAPVLCCTCGEVGCSSARVKIFNTGSSIIWKHFRTIRNWDFPLSYEFQIDKYRIFLEKIKNTPDKVL